MATLDKETAVLLRALNNMAAFQENGSHVRHFQNRAGFGLVWFGMEGERIGNARSTLRRVAEQLISIANEGEHCTFCAKVMLAFGQIAKRIEL